MSPAARIEPSLLVLMLLYGAASLLHHMHNATFLDDYPNMPAWLSVADVYLAWSVVAVTGVAAYLLLRGGFRTTGLLVAAAFASFGFDGLAHYAVAPWSAHTIGMHVTILTEVLLAAAVVVCVALLLARQARAARLARRPYG
jgi:hypothetical protein